MLLINSEFLLEAPRAPCTATTTMVWFSHGKSLGQGWVRTAGKRCNRCSPPPTRTHLWPTRKNRINKFVGTTITQANAEEAEAQNKHPPTNTGKKEQLDEPATLHTHHTSTSKLNLRNHTVKTTPTTTELSHPTSTRKKLKQIQGVTPAQLHPIAFQDNVDKHPTLCRTPSPPTKSASRPANHGQNTSPSKRAAEQNVSARHSHIDTN
jgi:hypothetical protein